MDINTLAEQSMIVRLRVHGWTGEVKDQEATEEVAAAHGADIRDAGVYKKNLFPKSALKGIQRAESDLRNYHYLMTLPWLDQGGRILSSKHFMTYTEGLRERKEAYESEARKLLDNYERLIEDAKVSLGSLFNEAEYPSRDVLRAAYSVETLFTPFPKASDFRTSINAQAFEDAKAHLEETTRTAAFRAEEILQTQVITAIAKIAERFAVTSGQPGSTFRDSLIGNLETLLGLAPEMSLADDSRLHDFCMRARVLCVDPVLVRSNANARATLARTATQLVYEMQQAFKAAA